MRRIYHALTLAAVLCIFAVPTPARDFIDFSGDSFKPAKVDESEVDIEIDGVLDEKIWEELPFQDGMLVIEPDTLAEVPYETHIRMFYTDKGLYVGIWNEQDPDTLISRLSSRDIFINRDDVAVTIDPGGQGLYAYWFGISLGGTLLDGTVLPERQYSNQWDGAWYGASAEHAEGWSAEYFLPWSMMSMPDSHDEVRKMGFYVSRFVAHRSERWAYPAYPATKPTFLSQLPRLEVGGVSPTQQFTFYPYASATYDNTEVGHEDSYKAGFDIFWRPSTNLQLTGTLKPDFGNVESDNVVVNLSSFETFFPEKRPFFLEGNEIFIATPRAQGFNGPPTTLLNTRRIGGPPRDPEITDFDIPDVELNQPTELEGALKVTGESGRLRYGVLGAVEDDTVMSGELNNQPFDFLQEGRDFAVARALYEDTAGGGRRSVGIMSTATRHREGDAYATGVDGHYLSGDGIWAVDGQVIHSEVSDVSGAGGFVDTTYTPNKGYRHLLKLQYFDDTVDFNDLGFLRRNDVRGLSYSYQRRISDHPRYKFLFNELFLVQNYNGQGQSVASGAFWFRDRQFKNNHWLYTEVGLFPARWDDINSEGNGTFRVKERFDAGVFYATDRSKEVSYRAGTFMIGEYLGDISRFYEAQVTWRPTDRFSMDFVLAYEDKDGWLLWWDDRDFTTYEAEFWRPRLEADFFISAKQQFRLTAQWAGIKAFEQERWLVPLEDGDLRPNPGPHSNSRNFSISRLTFQARYRWEIAPLSDLFVVYTRGSDVDSRPREDFNDLLHDSWTEPLVDVFVIKLRYRLGN